MRLFFKVVLASTLSMQLIAELEDESSCEEPCETEQHHHYIIRPPSVEEEHLWQERSDSSWPGKRDDNFIDEFLRQ